MKLPKIDVNFYKVILGVGFSLIWAQLMYRIWDQPAFTTFIWFYLIIGSTILKWVLFGIVDRIHLRIKLRAVKKELEECDMRVHESVGSNCQDDK